MKTLLTLLAILTVLSHGTAQLRTPATYLFEKLNWGQTPEESRKALGGVELKEGLQDSKGFFGSGSSKGKKYIFPDSLFQKQTVVSLMYDETTHKLSSVLVMFAWIGVAKGGIPEPKVWDNIGQYYGRPLKEGSLPTGGSVRTWSFDGTNLRAMRMSGAFTGIILMYSPKE